MPRLEGKVLVPSASVLSEWTAAEYTPVGVIERVRMLDRAVGAWTRGGRDWVLLLNVSDDVEELAEALEIVLDALGRNR